VCLLSNSIDITVPIPPVSPYADFYFILTEVRLVTL